MLQFLLQTLFLIVIAEAKIRNTKVSRTVKLDVPGSNLVIFENEINFMRDPQDSHYYFVIAKDYEWSFVALSVSQTDENNKERQLEFERVTSFPNEFDSQKSSMLENVMFFKIKLDDVNNRQRVNVNEYHKGRMEPYPKVIRVYEKQKVEVFDSKYPLTLYPTSETLNTYVLKVSDVHYKSQEPSDEHDDRVTYGPYKNVAPLTFEQIQLMFTFNYPLPQFSEAKRDIYVSHWGNIAIDEYYYIHNEAAGINGQFSRVDYQPHINPNHGANAVTSIDTTLPSYTKGLYYYDYIGNISSSNAERKDTGVEFNIQFRFPLFGQWKTDFNMGYNMPSQYNLYQDKKDQTKHTLEVNYMHAFEDSLTEDYTVKVILPEGATDIDIEVPAALKNFVDKIYLDKYFGTLDYFGRPMIVIKQSNAVYQLQDEMLRVNYRFDNSTSLYLEPLFVFGMIFSIYLFAIIYSRLSLDLKNKNQLKEEHAKLE